MQADSRAFSPTSWSELSSAIHTVTELLLTWVYVEKKGHREYTESSERSSMMVIVSIFWKAMGLVCGNSRVKFFRDGGDAVDSQ